MTRLRLTPHSSPSSWISIAIKITTLIFTCGMLGLMAWGIRYNFRRNYTFTVVQVGNSSTSTERPQAVFCSKVEDKSVVPIPLRKAPSQGSHSQSIDAQQQEDNLLTIQLKEAYHQILSLADPDPRVASKGPQGKIKFGKSKSGVYIEIQARNQQWRHFDLDPHGHGAKINAQWSRQGYPSSQKFESITLQDFPLISWALQQINQPTSVNLEQHSTPIRFKQFGDDAIRVYGDFIPTDTQEWKIKQLPGYSPSRLFQSMCAASFTALL